MSVFVLYTRGWNEIPAQKQTNKAVWSDQFWEHLLKWEQLQHGIDYKTDSEEGKCCLFLEKFFIFNNLKPEPLEDVSNHSQVLHFDSGQLLHIRSRSPCYACHSPKMIRNLSRHSFSPKGGEGHDVGCVSAYPKEVSQPRTWAVLLLWDTHDNYYGDWRIFVAKLWAYSIPNFIFDQPLVFQIPP